MGSMKRLVVRCSLILCHRAVSDGTSNHNRTSPEAVNLVDRTSNKLIAKAPIRLSAAIEAAQLKYDAMLIVKGFYARGPLSVMRCLFAILYHRCRLYRLERTLCVRRYPFPRRLLFTVFGLILLLVESSASVALTASDRNRYLIMLSS